MPDESSEKIIRLLEEIRDLTKERNGKIDALMQGRRERYEEAFQRHRETQARLLKQRRRFLWTLMPLLLLAIGFILYLSFWIIPRSEQREIRQWREEMQLIRSNAPAQPR